VGVCAIAQIYCSITSGQGVRAVCSLLYSAPGHALTSVPLPHLRTASAPLLPAPLPHCFRAASVPIPPPPVIPRRFRTACAPIPRRLRTAFPHRFRTTPAPLLPTPRPHHATPLLCRFSAPFPHRGRNHHLIWTEICRVGQSARVPPVISASTALLFKTILRQLYVKRNEPLTSIHWPLSCLLPLVHDFGNASRSAAEY
jgi:hypothetical protein